MKFMAVVLFSLATLAASPSAFAQHRLEMPGRGPAQYHNEMPEYRRGPSMGPSAGPMGGPPAGPSRGPRGRIGPDSLGADWGAQQNEAFTGVRERRYVPLARAIDEIRRRTPGGQLDAGLEQWGGRPAYRIRWATTNGQRIDYMVDAETGAILGTDGQ